MDALDQVIEKKLPRVAALTRCPRFSIERRLGFSPRMPRIKLMWAAQEEIVSDEAGDVRGEARVRSRR